MATQLTKAQLLSELEAARIENQRLSTENESLRSRVPQQRSNVRRAYAPPRNEAAERAHDAYVRALIASREEAMRTGKSVIVRR